MESILPLIRIVDLKKSYGVKEILKGINLDIFPGQVIGYIGPNGAGKSTTVKILTGLIEDFTGTVEINGINIQEDPLAVKALLGYVPENAELYDVLTPMEYLDFVGKLYGMKDNVILERSLKLLAAFGLEANANNRMDTFSKGMRQKVLLISGIIHNPQIIVLDEPLSGLDANAVIVVKELISLLAKEGKTIFYCSHMMDVVEKVSDRILLINQGSIIANGTIEELKTDPSESLEHIFAKLTNTGSSALDASNIITAIQ
ncbi:ABC-type transporter ATP-binding protein EcsA [compost metagenome]|uniref:ABC transporter ATP-binding protein n=1 Tax=Sphingobacterium paramultivorum TaxID=2886510 RepID=A0A7G5E9A6_9SPHI|nr:MULTISPECIES: ABC transporter ATP-binding protein [Sphingobacterium]MBB1647627.1 ABC transporter [Sphingobacterium sp. UME9]MCS4167048.1 ABC-2 type transport system ATP-binding protein [Sphingobacterium sp. BIGb0116]QMV70581.1 ABC transporter ATP-binding protein [Sphingobacterium paramultivorum]WET71634.1 MAG: ABC transporter ATP-binding protein [Sphingobacterium sp.]WSO14443.1 ABC transporter ATP-binding protein [Sphingobacterium paramultivorum]